MSGEGSGPVQEATHVSAGQKRTPAQELLHVQAGRAAMANLSPRECWLRLDSMGRHVLIVPDAVAQALREEVKRGWREIADMADGYSRNFPADSPVGHATRAMFKAVELADPEDLPVRSDQHRERLAKLLEWAGRGRLDVFIVGRGDWDHSQQWWVDYTANRHLHVHGTPSLVPGTTGEYVYSG